MIEQQKAVQNIVKISWDITNQHSQTKNHFLEIRTLTSEVGISGSDK